MKPIVADSVDHLSRRSVRWVVGRDNLHADEQKHDRREDQLDQERKDVQVDEELDEDREQHCLPKQVLVEARIGRLRVLHRAADENDPARSEPVHRFLQSGRVP